MASKNILGSDRFEKYSEEYKEECFYSWYSAGCPLHIKRTVPEYEGRKPSTTTLAKWRKDNGWDERARVMDAEITLKVDADIIERKKQDYMELSETGRKLIKKGMAYFDENEFDTSAAAVSAIRVGSQLMAKYSQAAEMIESVFSKTDDQITKEIYKLIGKTDSVEGEIVDDDSSEEEDDNS